MKQVPDDWSFGELVRYRSLMGWRNTLAVFVCPAPHGRAVIATKDRGKEQTVPLAQLKRDPQLQPELRANLRVIESDDPIIGAYALEIRYRRHWKQLAIVLNETDYQAIRPAVIASLQSAGVVVKKIDTPWVNDSEDL